MSGLGKLVKYEMKAVGRIMLPLYGAFIAVTVLFGATLTAGAGDNSDAVSAAAGTTVFQFVMLVVYILSAAALVVFTFVMLIMRFYRNLLGNEGYFCFTLPVGVNAHIANKTLSAGIWVVAGGAAGCISAFILMMFFVTPAELLDEVKRTVLEITNYIGGAGFALAVFELIVLAVLTAAETGIKIYAAISAGQLWSKHRIAGAVLSYIGFAALEGILANVLYRVIPVDVSLILEASDFAGFEKGIGSLALVTAVLLGLYWLVVNRLLERKLNLQ